jgi:transcriptional regulator with XRE-family HTH domain
MVASRSGQLVAASVRRLRRERGWSQEELGAKAGLHRTYIGAIERCEENITLRTLDLLADALSVAQVELFQRRAMRVRSRDSAKVVGGVCSPPR